MISSGERFAVRGLHGIEFFSALHALYIAVFQDDGEFEEEVVDCLSGE